LDALFLNHPTLQTQLNYLAVAQFPYPTLPIPRAASPFHLSGEFFFTPRDTDRHAGIQRGRLELRLPINLVDDQFSGWPTGVADAVSGRPQRKGG